MKLHPYKNNTYFYLVHHKQHINFSDQELLHHYYHKKDESWLGILLERYLHLIFGVCMKYLKNETEAKDHTQQICIKVIRELPKNEVKYFKAWLYQVTKNHCLMYLRKNKPRHLPLDATAEPAAEIPSGQSEFIKKEKQYDLLESALHALIEPQQNCVRLFYYHQKSYQEIADEQGYSLKEVKSFIQNGRRNIKIFIEKSENGQTK